MKRAFVVILGICVTWTIQGCGRQQPSAEQQAPAASSSVTAPATGNAGGEASGGMQRTPAPADAKVFFVTPKDGETVTSPFQLKFGVSGIALAPAGDSTPGSGHGHLLVDAELPDLNQPIPKNDHYLHFGKGQDSTEVTLPPGRHTLQLLLGDANHVPHDPPVMSDKITVNVE